MASAAYVEDDDEGVEDNDAPDQSKLEGFLIKFDSAWTPQSQQRAQSLQCRRFASIPGAMWEGNGWDEFSANMIRIEDNKVAAGLEKILNDYRANRVMVDFRPVDDATGAMADDETADTLDGLFRADSYRSSAGQAFDNAFDEGASGGMGAFRLCNELEDEHDPDNDNQVINFELIVDADQSVFFDPNSKRYDKSDAQWACVVTAVARASFNEEYGANRATSFSFATWKPYYDWFTPDVVRIAEWYQVENKKQARITLTHAITGEEKRVWKSDVTPEWLDEQKASGWKAKDRDVPRKRVHKYILSGAEILKDCGLIAGPNIPVICFYGRRFFIDNQERFRGHTQLAMDLSRVRNTVLSNLVESVGSQPRQVPIFYPEELTKEMADDWARANKDRLTFLRKNPMFDENGALIPRALEYLPAPELSQQMGALLQITDTDIAALTNADDGADEVKANVSHEAMDLAATRTDEKSSGYMDNWRLTMEWNGRVYLGMAQETYVEEGRKLPTRTEDGEEGSAVLLQPKMDRGRYLTINDFASGKFNVVADVTEASATKRDKTVRKALGVAQIAGAAQNPDLANAALITAVTNMDGDGMEDFKKYTRKLGVSLGVFEPTDEEKQDLQEQAAGKEQQPDPATVALLAQAKKLNSDAGLADAKTQTEQANALQKTADAKLKDAQADAVGGPERAPEVPTGLEGPTGLADVADKMAGARLKDAQAEHLSEQANDKRIRRGAELDQWEREHALAQRQQDHVESQPQERAA